MNKDLWQKACAVLLMMILGLAGWGLAKVYDIDIWKAVTEERMATWHTPLNITAAATPASHIMLAGQYSSGLSCEQRLEFAQRTMLRTYSQIKGGAYDPALKTLLLGLEDSGLTCREHKDGLNCER